MYIYFIKVIILSCSALASLPHAGDYDERPFDLDLYERVLDQDLCQQQLSDMRAFEFYDASFRIPQGMLKGNFMAMGSFHQCLGVKQKTEDVPIEGKYCMVQALIQNPMHFPSFSKTSWLENRDWVTMTLDNNLTEKMEEHSSSLKIGSKLGAQNTVDELFNSLALSLAVCIPKTCSVVDILAPILDNTEIDFYYNVAFCRLPDDRPLVAADYTAFAILSLIIVLTISSTAYDIRHVFILKTDPAEVNKLLRSFSMYTNTKVLLTFKDEPESLDCLDGIRVLSICWVIIGHSFSNFLSRYTANILDILDWADSPRSLWMMAADLSVDTFFVLSGLLLVFTSARKIKQGQLLKNLHLFYLHRLLRMFPLLAFVVLLQASIFNYISDGVDWRFVASSVQMCRDYWWSALLHIQNIVNPASLCLIHTWYLSVDIQLHVLSPLILFWVLGGRRSAWSGLGLGVIASLTASTIYVFLTDGTYYYQNTLARSPPFVLGMVLGYILHINRGMKLRLPTWFVSIGYVVTSGLSFYCVYHSYLDANSELLDSLNMSFVRPCWGLCVCWLIFACINGYGGPINWFLSLKMWKFPARISYAMYLFHYPILFVMRGSNVTPIYFSMEAMWLMFASVLVYTVIVSTAACALIDAPFSTLQNMVLTALISPKTSKTSSVNLPNNTTSKDNLQENNDV